MLLRLNQLLYYSLICSGCEEVIKMNEHFTNCHFVNSKYGILFLLTLILFAEPKMHVTKASAEGLRTVVGVILEVVENYQLDLERLQRIRETIKLSYLNRKPEEDLGNARECGALGSVGFDL